MSIVLFCTVPTSLHSLASGMTVFDGSNFSELYERVQFSLGVLDLDLALITINLLKLRMTVLRGKWNNQKHGQDPTYLV